jgi:hypothetical protein
MKVRAKPPARASTLIVTLVTVTALSLMAAFTLVRVLPRIRMAYQNAAWQEARVAAEAGIDIAMNDLLVNASAGKVGNWSGWQEEIPAAANGKTVPPGLLKQLAKATPDKLPGVQAKIARKLAKKGAPPDYSVTTTAPIYLDNLRVSASAGVAGEVDVRLWGLQPNAAPHNQWYRIRSMATCALPPRALDVPAQLDGLLRRFSLRRVRPSLRKDDAGRPSTIGLPNISRTIEALVEPIYPFELAVWTGGSLTLGNTGAWNIDSFDSTDDLKSAAGFYPGRGAPQVQSNASVASSQPRAFESLYGPLIAANGAEIRGAVATNGGDDPATPAHENITGDLRIDPSRVRSDFVREMPTAFRPTSVTGVLPPPLAGGPFVPGPVDTPAVYSVPGSLTKLRISAPADKTEAAVIIMIDGSLDLAGPLIIPPTVTALLFVRGNITFRDNVNSGPWNSNRAAQLLIFGDSVRPTRQKLEAIGNISVTAAFYGPLADLVLDGGTTWIGSVAGGSLRIIGGGDGGIHYDEALATLGPPISFRISRYVEDVRE